MIHLGDITKLKGYEIPAVDVICGGSPCQDLSIAGNRAGLDGERSGLFMEQIRVIKEMRNATAADDIRLAKPRFMVWENVPGAFSSNNGEDFRSVIEETARIADGYTVIPRSPDGWTNAGAVMGRGWSIAWRVHNAQFWGTAQRRRRIALVADFGGDAAPEILFERKGLSRNPRKDGKKEEKTTRRTKSSFRKAISFQERAGKPGGGKGILIQDEHTGALSTLNNQSVFTFNVKRIGMKEDRTDYENDSCITLTADGENSCAVEGVVRHITPLEEERLQGFPDGWTDIGDWIDSKGKKHKGADAPRYKALGNSIALPFWQWLACRICAQYDRDITMGSLFDGIGGFPLVFERCGAKAVWASEIEEFPIAVTKYHFPEEE